MKQVAFLSAAALALLGCGPAEEVEVDDETVPASVYLRYNIFDFEVDRRLSTIEQQAQPAEDRESWSTTVNDVRENFQGQLGEDFELPSNIVAGAADIDLRFQDDGTLLGKFEMPFRGDSLQVDLHVRPNDETGLVEDTIFVNRLPRFEVTHDIDLTFANAFILDAEQNPRFSIDFNRQNENFNVKFLNLGNDNAFNLAIDNELLFVERDVNDNGFGTNNFELQLRINNDDFAGRFDIILPFLGRLKFCFGEGDLRSVNCE